MQSSDRIKPSPSELDAFRKSYMHRQLAAFLAGVLWIIVVLAVVISGLVRTTIGEVAILGTWLVAMSVLLAVWRCPRCRELFGRRLHVARCPHCYLALEDY